MPEKRRPSPPWSSPLMIVSICPKSGAPFCLHLADLVGWDIFKGLSLTGGLKESRLSTGNPFPLEIL